MGAMAPTSSDCNSLTAVSANPYRVASYNDSLVLGPNIILICPGVYVSVCIPDAVAGSTCM